MILDEPRVPGKRMVEMPSVIAGWVAWGGRLGHSRGHECVAGFPQWQISGL